MDNIQILFIVIIFGIFIGTTIFTFVKKTRDQKIENLKQWLKYAVVVAEREFGAKTGQLKLRYVYNTAVNKFPWIVSVVSFETFDIWVKEALEWMEKQLESNPAINAYINK